MRAQALFPVVLALASCRSTTEPLVRDLRIEVAATRTPCWGAFFVSTCLQIRRVGQVAWEPLLPVIEGFTHVEGYLYTLDVRVYRLVKPPEDGPGERYELRRVVSRRPAT